MLQPISQQNLLNPQIHRAFHKLLEEKFIDKKSPQLTDLPMEIKYAFVELSSLGVLFFSEDKIELAPGMESWMWGYWREISVA